MPPLYCEGLLKWTNVDATALSDGGEAKHPNKDRKKL